MAKILLLRIPDPDDQEIVPEQPDELTVTLVKFFGDICADVHVHTPTPELEQLIEERIQRGDMPRQSS